MRVLWLVKGLGPGGAERLLVAAAAVRDRERFDYQAAFLLPWKTALVGDLEALGVPVTCLDAGRERDLRWSGRLRRLLQQERPHVVHVHSPYPASVARLVARSLPVAWRPAVVTTEHSLWDRHAVLTRWASRATSRLDTHRVAVSSGVLASLPRRDRLTTEVVIHGVDVDSIRAERAGRHGVREALGIAPEEVVVGTVANFRALKAYPDLMHAAVQVVQQRPDVRFVAVGQGPLEHQIRQLHADLELGDRFLLLGYRPDAVRMLAASDIFVLASLQEGLPVALMEALALGLPVVATRVGGLPEAVREGIDGVLVRPGDPAGLAEALITMVDDPDGRRRMGASAAERSRMFDVRAAARRLEAIYVEVSGST